MPLRPAHEARSLATLQRWMQTVITHPDGVTDGARSPAAQAEIALPDGDVERVVRPSATQTGVERLHVYANAYIARLLECLREEFPATSQAIGVEAFDGLAFEYLQHYPSESYTLSDLGANFPRFLAETRPPNEDDDGGPDWADFLIDLARLERTYSELFDGPGVESTPPIDFDELLRIPTSEWGSIRFEPAPCLRLESFRFPVHEFASAVRNQREDEELPAIDPAPTWLAVSRLNYRVRRWTLTETQYRLLSRLADGDSLQTALEFAFCDATEDDNALAGSLREWFAEWSSAKLFTTASADGGA